MSDQDDSNRIQRLEERIARLEERLYGLSNVLGIEPSAFDVESGERRKPVGPLTGVRGSGTPQVAKPAGPLTGVRERAAEPVGPLTGVRGSGIAAREKAPEQPPRPPVQTHPQPVAESVRKAAVPAATPQIAEVVRASAAPVVSPPRVAAPVRNLEQDIGLKWAGWVGAVVLVLSAGMGFVYAYQQGWFNQLPPLLKIILMALVGFSFIGAGEVVYRRINPLASTGLFGAGVSILFIVAYAGNHYYGLYPEHLAFFLMAFAVMVGALIALRGKFLSVAVLSIVGGNLVPFMLSSGQSPDEKLLGYALALQIMALAMAHFGATSKWWVLRTLMLISTTFWTGIVLFENKTGTYVVLVAELVYAVLFHSEVILTTAIKRAEDAASVPRNARPTGGVVFAFCVTVVLCLMGLLTLDKEPRNFQTSWVLMLALAFGWQGVNLTGLLGGRLKAHADGFKIQAALLLMLAVPVGLRGFWMTGAWGMLALGFVALGAQIKLPGLRGFAVATFILGFAKWFLWDTGFWLFDTPALSVLPAPFLNAYCGAALILALSSVASCVLVKRQFEKSVILPFALAVAPVALAFWAGTVEIHRLFGSLKYDEQLTLTQYWTVLSALAAVAHASCERFNWKLAGRPLATAALVLFALACVKFCVADTLLWSDGARAVSTVKPVLNQFGMCLLMLICDAVWLMRLRLWEGDEGGESGVNTGVTWVALALMFWAGTVELHRLFGDWDIREHSALTVYWAVLAALAAVVNVFCKRLNWKLAGHPLGEAALVLFILASAKFAVFDTLYWGGSALAAIPAAPVLNPFGFNVALLVLTAGLLRGLRAAEGDARVEAAFNSGLAAIAVGLVFWAGSWEIHRCCSQLAVLSGTGASGAAWGEQMALSLYWSVFAISLIVAGFVFRRAVSRYAGLALFMLTLIKVAVFDLGFLSLGYRVLSFAGLGILLMATSVLYGYFSPRLLAKTEAAPGA